jgi:DNA processing protein
VNAGTAADAATDVDDDIARTGDALALAALPRMRRERLRALLDAWPDPRVAAAEVAAGRAGPVLAGLSRHPEELARHWAAAIDLATPERRVPGRGTRVLLRSDDGFPMNPAHEGCPGAVFVEGDTACLRRPLVAIVGTRAATPHGLADAHQLAGELAACGAIVVSGMALGIDGAAHVGALDAGGPTVGVIATGLDRCYPRRHTALHQRVRARGLLVTEQPFGTLPAAHRFPTRNHLIAAMAHVVVVVEATVPGGAMITAEIAGKLGTTLMAVPGSRRNPAAEGCNRLIKDGAGVVLSTDDVLVALSMSPAARIGAPAPPPEGPPAAVLAACGGEPATVDQLVSRTGIPVGEVATAVEVLVWGGHLRRERGWLWPL